MSKKKVKYKSLTKDEIEELDLSNCDYNKIKKIIIKHVSLGISNYDSVFQDILLEGLYIDQEILNKEIDYGILSKLHSQEPY